MLVRLSAFAFCVLLFTLFPGDQNHANAQLTFDPAFPNLTFSRPVDLQHSGDGTDRLFVVEQNTGLVRVFQNDRAALTSDVYLNVTDRFSPGSSEEGLLGLAFHPDFANTGFLYVYYTALSPRRSIIERFRVDSLDQAQVDRSTGEVLMSLSQPNSNHNGGHLRFGPDGYLYIGLGDGGGSGDPDLNGQDTTTLLGSILRIDVDSSTAEMAYGIPADNPFVTDTTGSRKEIFAWGMRNPWKFSFDVDGNLWAGDVGQGSLEEIDIIENGKNYGWKTMEGNQCFSPPSGCDQSGLELPVHVYGRSLGRSITGGFRYRGNRAPHLSGSYIYADFVTGRIWALPFENETVGTAGELFDTNLGIASFGEDEDGELYFTAFDGRIYHFTGETVGVENPDAIRQEFVVYPNPSSESVTFVSSAESVSGQLLVFDVLGRQVFEAELPPGNGRVESGAQSGATGTNYKSFTWAFSSDHSITSGLYFFRVLSGPVIHTGSFVVVR